MKKINPEILDLADAIYCARKSVPYVDSDLYFGEIAGGTFRSDDKKSEFWFGVPSKTVWNLLYEQMV